jgi:hypothetical protein
MWKKYIKLNETDSLLRSWYSLGFSHKIPAFYELKTALPLSQQPTPWSHIEPVSFSPSSNSASLTILLLYISWKILVCFPKKIIFNTDFQHNTHSEPLTFNICISFVQTDHLITAGNVTCLHYIYLLQYMSSSPLLFKCKHFVFITDMDNLQSIFNMTR